MGIFEKIGFSKRAKNKQKMKKTAKKKKRQTAVKSDAVLSEWEDKVKAVSEHPLSQARIINDNLLNELTGQLSTINEKLSALEKLDKILELLKKNELYTESVEGVNIRDLTIKDREMLDLMNKKGSVEATTLSKMLKISRSTASLRLNRLFATGFVEKFSKGKVIYYRIKEKQTS